MSLIILFVLLGLEISFSFGHEWNHNIAFTAPAVLCINSGFLTDPGGGMLTGSIYRCTGVTDDGIGITYSFDHAAAGKRPITDSSTDENVCTGLTNKIEVLVRKTIIELSQNTFIFCLHI